MVYKFRANLKNQLTALVPLIIMAAVIAIGFLFYYEGFDDVNFRRIIAITYILLSLPVFFLHVEYLFNDFDLKLEIDPERKEIVFQKRNIIRHVKFNEIREINFYGETKDFNNLPFQSYFYYQFKLNDNTSFIVSCFTARSLDRIIGTMPLKKKRRLFASMLFETDLD